MFASQSDYNAFINSLATALLKLKSGNKQQAADCAEKALEGIRGMLTATPALSWSLMQFSTHSNAAASRVDASEITLASWAWFAFLGDLRAKVLV